MRTFISLCVFLVASAANAADFYLAAPPVDDVTFREPPRVCHKHVVWLFCGYEWRWVFYTDGLWRLAPYAKWEQVEITHCRKL